MKKLLLFGALAFGLNAYGQNLISATEIYTKSANIVTSNISSYGWNTAGMTINDVVSYKITYNTTDVFGSATVASGALYVPIGICDTLPLVSWQHGTEFDKTFVPSNGNNFYQSSALLFAGNGYITTQPDYLGLGDNPGFHPYLHWESEATAAIDLIRAAREFLSDSLSILDNNQLFLSGYSQGGHATMSTHKYINENSLQNEFNVVASAPIAGPYALSYSTFDMVFDLDSTYYRSEFGPYILASYQLVYSNLYSDYNEYYDAPYDSLIEAYLTDGTYSNTEWNTLIPENHYNYLQDSVVNNLLSNPNHPVRQNLRANDVHNWVPMEPVRMLYSGLDSMVTPQNSLMALDTMTALGAIDVRALNVDPGGTHETGYIPTTTYALAWFDSLATPCQYVASISPIIENSFAKTIVVYPNPTTGNFSVDLREKFNSLDVIIRDLHGKKVQTKKYLNSQILNFNLNQPAGIYFLTIQSKEQKVVFRLVKE